MGIAARAFRNQTSGGPITTSPELAAFLQVYGGWSTHSGVTVTPANAMACAAVSAAVGLISESIAVLPLMIYERLDPRGKERARSHPLWQVLHNRPNEWQNAFEWREQTALHLVLWGNTYCLIVRNSKGELRELIPIHPTRVVPKRSASWLVTYEVAGPNGDTKTFARDQIFHIKDRSFDGLVGRPRIFDAKDSIGLALSAERWGAQLFGNGARPSGLLSTDRVMKEDQVTFLAKSWGEAHGGDNALGTAILDGGLKWTPMVMNNTDAQFLETRLFQLREVARVWRVSPSLIGDLEHAATRANVESFGLQFLKFTLLSWLTRYEAAINDQLMPSDSGMFAEFLLDAFERADLVSRTAHYSAGIRDGYLSQNDVRDLENRNPIEHGDEYRRAESIHGTGSGENTDKEDSDDEENIDDD